MPDSTKLPGDLPRGEQRDGAAMVLVRDRVNGHAIDFDRVIELPAGRVTPGDYRAWQKFAQEADALVGRDVLIAR